jgi:hypothetical protein
MVAVLHEERFTIEEAVVKGTTSVAPYGLSGSPMKRRHPRLSVRAALATTQLPNAQHELPHGVDGAAHPRNFGGETALFFNPGALPQTPRFCEAWLASK